MFTGQDNAKVAVEAMRRGTMGFLQKPFMRDHLTSLFPRPDGDQVENEARPIAD